MFHSLPWWLSGKEITCQWRRQGFNLWVRKIPWSSKWQPTPVFLPGEYHGQRSLVGYSPCGCKRVRLDSVNKQQQKSNKTCILPLHLGTRFERLLSQSCFPLMYLCWQDEILEGKSTSLLSTGFKAYYRYSISLQTLILILSGSMLESANLTQRFASFNNTSNTDMGQSIS